ncbi:hypothetical protein PR048_022472 [Dryococelus australis]|uniref:Uncharacterized protein n=1 Tax=Dryococelus australis TaxID=614101 RepID=A0ABQ9H130_9NEOP|nr:hypothetical protein PR048_022472 [Dryococelus australis]
MTRSAAKCTKVRYVAGLLIYMAYLRARSSSSPARFLIASVIAKSLHVPTARRVEQQGSSPTQKQNESGERRREDREVDSNYCVGCYSTNTSRSQSTAKKVEYLLTCDIKPSGATLLRQPRELAECSRSALTRSIGRAICNRITTLKPANKLKFTTDVSSGCTKYTSVVGFTVHMPVSAFSLKCMQVAVACGEVLQGKLVLAHYCTFSVHAAGASNHHAAWGELNAFQTTLQRPAPRIQNACVCITLAIGPHGVWQLLENGVQLSPSSVTADNQCAVYIGIFVHKAWKLAGDRMQLTAAYLARVHHAPLAGKARDLSCVHFSQELINPRADYSCLSTSTRNSGRVTNCVRAEKMRESPSAYSHVALCFERETLQPEGEETQLRRELCYSPRLTSGAGGRRRVKNKREEISDPAGATKRTERRRPSPSRACYCACVCAHPRDAQRRLREEAAACVEARETERQVEKHGQYEKEVDSILGVFCLLHVTYCSKCAGGVCLSIEKIAIVFFSIITVFMFILINAPFVDICVEKIILVNTCSSVDCVQSPARKMTYFRPRDVEAFSLYTVNMNCEYGLPLTSSKTEPRPASSLSDCRLCRFCDRVFTFGQKAHRHERITCNKSPFRMRKNYENGHTQFVQGDKLRNHIKNCNNSCFESQQKMPSIPLARSVGTDYTDNYDEIVNAKDGMSGVIGSDNADDDDRYFLDALTHPFDIFAATRDVKKAEDFENTAYLFPGNPNEPVDRLHIRVLSPIPIQRLSEHHLSRAEDGSAPPNGAEDRQLQLQPQTHSPHVKYTTPDSPLSYYSGATGMKGLGKREIPEKTRRPAASSGTIPACENLEAALPGIETGFSRWEAVVTLGAVSYVIRAADQETWRWVCPTVVNLLLESASGYMNKAGTFQLYCNSSSVRIERVSEEVWAAYNIEVLRADGGEEVRIEQRWNEGRGKRKIPEKTIVRHYSHLRKSGNRTRAHDGAVARYSPPIENNRVRIPVGIAPGYPHVGIKPEDFLGDFPFSPAFAYRCLVAIYLETALKSWMDPPWEPHVQGQEARERYGRQLHARLAPHRSYAQDVQCSLSLDRHMNKVMMPLAMLNIHKSEEYTAWIQVDIKQGSGKCSFCQIPEKTRRLATSTGTIYTCENPGVTPPGIEPGSPRWEASRVTTIQPHTEEGDMSFVKNLLGFKHSATQFERQAGGVLKDHALLLTTFHQYGHVLYLKLNYLQFVYIVTDIPWFRLGSNNAVTSTSKHAEWSGSMCEEIPAQQATVASAMKEGELIMIRVGIIMELAMFDVVQSSLDETPMQIRRDTIVKAKQNLEGQPKLNFEMVSSYCSPNQLDTRPSQNYETIKTMPLSTLTYSTTQPYNRPIALRPRLDEVISLTKLSKKGSSARRTELQATRSRPAWSRTEYETVVQSEQQEKRTSVWSLPCLRMNSRNTRGSINSITANKGATGPIFTSHSGPDRMIMGQKILLAVLSMIQADSRSISSPSKWKPFSAVELDSRPMRRHPFNQFLALLPRRGNYLVQLWSHHLQNNKDQLGFELTKMKYLWLSSYKWDIEEMGYLSVRTGLSKRVERGRVDRSKCLDFVLVVPIALEMLRKLFHRESYHCLPIYVYTGNGQMTHRIPPPPNLPIRVNLPAGNSSIVSSMLLHGSMERCQNEKAEETGDPRENSLTNGIVRHDSHLRNSDLFSPECIMYRSYSISKSTGSHIFEYASACRSHVHDIPWNGNMINEEIIDPISLSDADGEELISQMTWSVFFFCRVLPAPHCRWRGVAWRGAVPCVATQGESVSAACERPCCHVTPVQNNATSVPANTLYLPALWANRKEGREPDPPPPTDPPSFLFEPPPPKVLPSPTVGGVRIAVAATRPLVYLITEYSSRRFVAVALEQAREHGPELMATNRRMNKVMRLMAILIFRKAEEYVTYMQVDLKQLFQKYSVNREQSATVNTVGEGEMYLKGAKICMLRYADYTLPLDKDSREGTNGLRAEVACMTDVSHVNCILRRDSCIEDKQCYVPLLDIPEIIFIQENYPKKKVDFEAEDGNERRLSNIVVHWLLGRAVRQQVCAPEHGRLEVQTSDTDGEELLDSTISKHHFYEIPTAGYTVRQVNKGFEVTFSVPEFAVRAQVHSKMSLSAKGTSYVPFIRSYLETVCLMFAASTSRQPSGTGPFVNLRSHVFSHLHKSTVNV